MSIAGKSKSELFDIWKKRLNLARDLHKEKIINWADKIFLEYSGDQKYDTDTGEKYVQIAQVVMSVEESIQPHLFFQNPVISVKAKRPEWEKREKLVAAVVNQQYTDILPSGHGIELENELVVLDARLVGFGCTKTSWGAEGEIFSEEEPSFTDKVKGILTGEKKTLERPVITKETGHLTERVNPLKLFLDPFSDHITKQKFVIEVMDVTREDLQKPRYDQSVVKTLEPSSVLIPESRFQTKSEREKYLNDPDFKGYRIYEIHDIENRLIHTLADGSQDFLEFSSPYPLPEGSQYSFLWFIEKPNSVYPLPPVKFYRKRATEFSYIYSEVASQIDKFLPKIVLNLSQLSQASKQKYKLGGLGAVIEAETNASAALSVFNPQVQTDLFKYMAMIKDLMNMESGLSDYELFNPEERKATEAAIIQRSTRARRFKPQKRVKGFLRNQAHKIWMILSQNASEEHFIKVTGEEGLEWWQDPETGKRFWTNENIAGDYSFDMDVESMAPPDEAVRRKQNVEGLKAVLDPGLEAALKKEKKELIVSPLFEKFSSENLGVKDRNRILRNLEILTPEEEHDQWIQGIYPPVNPKEDIQDHYQKHLHWINSPYFHSLPREIQEGALSHVESYAPFIQKFRNAGKNNRASLDFSSVPMSSKLSPSVPRTSPLTEVMNQEEI